ncbi:uncharacterized protein B0T23DRAFT_123529 [Neurospora hispaniola]|uniref:Secreted protein n=1 Tax=Neurospora hispaniola TaxID=588809 RepID=A0AAJ0IAH9_9PEZI|nr:hypothetical protein B0T23DRAFT_123529 [Neurospora hispaniola]
MASRVMHLGPFFWVLEHLTRACLKRAMRAFADTQSATWNSCYGIDRMLKLWTLGYGGDDRRAGFQGEAMDCAVGWNFVMITSGPLN